ncbi:MAG: hypothetical protein ACRC1K_02815 [Planctomycetia bacterium]
MTTADAVPRVLDDFEHRLLTLLDFFLGFGSPERAVPVLLNHVKMTEFLSPDAVLLIKQRLAVGIVDAVARRGGWRRRRFLRRGSPTAGRLWERRPMEERALSFTGRSLDFLRWATAATPRRPEVDEPRRYAADPEKKSPSRATVGDELLVFLAYGALRTVLDAAPLRWRPVFVHHPLVRLGYAEDFCDPPPSVTATVQVDADLDWSFWTAGPGEWVLEALEPWLAEQWATAERAMLTQTTSRRSLVLGQRRGRTLQEYLDAVDAAGRRDLGRFVLSAAAFDFPSRRSVAALSEVWTDRFRRLSDRVELYRAVQVLPAAVERLGRWQAEARGVGYWDEGYTVAQAWKTDWEAVDGDGLHRRAAEFRRDAEPLAVG